MQFKHSDVAVEKKEEAAPVGSRFVRAGLPGDSDVRPALRAELLAKHSGDGNTVLLEELGLCRGQARVDLAVVNGCLHGYEIKSDRDSLHRLDKQVDLYGKVLDRATLVVGWSHIQKSLNVVPDWWGILLIRTVKGSVQFQTIRRGRANPDRDARALVELLWLDHAIALLEQRGAARGLRGKPRRIAWDRVCEFFSIDEIATVVRSHLKARPAMPKPPPRS